MFFDVNISCEFESAEDLNKTECSGFCYTSTLESSLEPPKIDRPVYSRIDLEYSPKLDQSTITKYKHKNVICLVTDNISYIPSMIKLQPDLIRISPESVKYMKKSVVRSIVESKMFIEMRTRDALYSSKERVQWLSAVRRILKFGGFKSLVISTGAKINTELRSEQDIFKMMNIFGLSNDRIGTILNNSEIMLRAAAMRRYALNGSVATSTDQGRFKNDFIIKFHECRK